MLLCLSVCLSAFQSVCQRVYLTFLLRPYQFAFVGWLSVGLHVRVSRYTRTLVYLFAFALGLTDYLPAGMYVYLFMYVGTLLVYLYSCLILRVIVCFTFLFVSLSSCL